MPQSLLRPGYAAALALAWLHAASAQPLFVNEIHYDNVGTDTGEAIEIVGPAGTALDGWELVLYNGSASQLKPYNVVGLDGTIPDQCAGFGTAVVTFPSNGIQNGAPDGWALVDPDGNVVQFASYEGSFTAAEGPAAGLGSVDIGVIEAGSTPIGSSLQLVGDGPDGLAWSDPAGASFGELNVGQSFLGIAGCGAPPAVDRITPADGEMNVALDADVELRFSEPVVVSGDWFALECTGSGAVAAAVVGDGETFTIMPASPFAHVERCTLTVDAGQVADLGDPPSSLASDFISSFTTRLDAGECGEAATPISAIQGSGLDSPLVDTAVIIEAIVTGDYQGGSHLDGFFVQEEDADADADAATSEGIFVFDADLGVDVFVGDRVRVAGTVTEFFGLTQITDVVSVEVCETGLEPLASPVPLTLPFADGEDFERQEGMLVDLGDGLAITENFNQGRFGEVVLAGGGRAFNPTQVAMPGEAALAAADANSRNRIILDDARNGRNREPILNPDGRPLDAGSTTRSGSTVRGLAVMAYAFGAYRLQPVALEVFDTNPRPAAPDLPGDGNLRIASVNVLNFFTTLDEAGARCGPPPGIGCRGADSELELERQRDKLVSALATLDADVIGLVELENNGFGAESAIADLLGALDEAGAGPYAFARPGRDFIGDDAIRVGLAYRTTTVELAPGTSVEVLDDVVVEALDAGLALPLFNGPGTNRASMAATFRELASGETVTVVVNHFKSKGASGLDAAGGVCDPDPGADPNCDQGDGQGYWNARRSDAARALLGWLETDPTASGEGDVLVLGDLNAYAMEDPIAILEDDGFVNLIAERIGDEAYSFVFFGEFGYLDYALGSTGLASQVTGIADWHVNADEPVATDYNTEGKSDAQLDALYAPDAFRSSDHDPLIVELRLVSPAGAARDLARTILETDLGAFTGRWEFLRKIQRHVLARRAGVAARLLEHGAPRAARAVLRLVLARVDGHPRPRDSMVAGEARDTIAAQIESLLARIE